MAVTTAAQGARAAASRTLDLKWSLTLRVFAVALACFLVAAALAFYGTYREIGRDNDAAADLLVRYLQVQLWRLDSVFALQPRFPDWDPVVQRALKPGQCVQFFETDGRLRRSDCMGTDLGADSPPAWFLSLSRWMLGTHSAITRPMSYRGKTYGTLVVTTDTDVALASIWRDVSRLLGLTALVIGAICLLQYVAISRALRPAKEILVGLDKLARGDLSCRLPSFRLVELQRISEVFNALAASLDQTMRERTQLAARLVEGQEEERRRLARELHDDLAQTLSAISAGAASIKATAATEYPTLVGEAERLAQASLATVRSLRTTLENLRPPEIDDFGLAASLAALAKDQERLSGGKLKILLEMDSALDTLPPMAAAYVYRIVQEGLTNIGKHAHASRAHVALDLDPALPGQPASERRWLALTIEDNGCGAVDGGVTARNGRLGLIGMRERAMALGGQLDVMPLDGGFKLRVVIPFQTAEARQ
jgi:two-component system, NarL family, sensor histidine kinase UhpB